MYTLPPEIIGKIGGHLDYKSRNNMMLVCKMFICAHYDLKCHYITVASKDSLARLMKTIEYVMKIKPNLVSLIIFIKGLDDVGGGDGSTKILLPDLEDLSMSIVNCSSIDSVLDMFDEIGLKNASIYYRPRQEDISFRITGRKRCVKLLPDHDVSSFDKYRIDELTLITNDADLSKMNFANIGNLHLLLQGNGVVLSPIRQIHMAQTLNLINYENTRRILEYFKGEGGEEYIRASRIEKIEMNFESGLYLVCCNSNILPTCLELIKVLGVGLKIVEITLIGNTSFLTHMFYFLPAVAKHVILTYYNHDTYIFSRILKLVFPYVCLVNKYDYIYDGDITDNCKDIGRWHAAIQDETLRNDMSFVKFVGTRG